MSKVKVFISEVTFGGDRLVADALHKAEGVPVYLGEDQVGRLATVEHNGKSGFDVTLDMNDVLLVPVFKAFEPDKGSIAYVTMVPRAENKWG
jgi:hypothetical protein